MTDSTANQPARAKNIEALVSIFKSGIRPKDKDRSLYVELEHHLVKSDLSPIDPDDEQGAAWLCEQILAATPTDKSDIDDIRVKIVAGTVDAHVGPGGQVVFVGGPYDMPGEVRMDFEQFDRLGSAILEPAGKRLINEGYHPSALACELGLTDTADAAVRARFEHAEAGVKNLIVAGAQTRISLDFASEADCLRKLRLLSIATPVLSLMCDNLGRYEKKRSPHALMRTALLEAGDPHRAGLVPGVLDEDFSFARYAQYVLDAPAGIALGKDGAWTATDKTFGEVYAEKPMTAEQAAFALAQFSNDVTLTNRITIETFDSMPAPFVCAAAMLVKGLFFVEESMAELEEMFAEVTAKDVACARAALMDDGFDATVYGRPAGALADKFIELAQANLRINERNFISALAAMVRFRKTLASMAC